MNAYEIVLLAAGLLVPFFSIVSAAINVIKTEMKKGHSQRNNILGGV